MAAPALDAATGRWIYGDTPDGGTSGCLANTIVSFREERISSNPNVYQTWVSTSQGVSVVFAGQQTVNIYNLIKSMTITVV